MAMLTNKSSPTNSIRKRRGKGSPRSNPATVIDLDEEETCKKDSGENKKEKKISVSSEGSKVGENESSSALPSCIDQLREELSCAICLEICFEPCTTPCGHSFCRKCLQTAADKCDKKCPKCRQFISNGRFFTVNTVLRNTIQLLFPQEVEARKVAANRAGSARQQAVINVDYVLLSREEVVEITRKLEVLERNQEELRDLVSELMRNQRPPSSS